MLSIYKEYPLGIIVLGSDINSKVQVDKEKNVTQLGSSENNWELGNEWASLPMVLMDEKAPPHVMLSDPLRFIDLPPGECIELVNKSYRKHLSFSQTKEMQFRNKNGDQSSLRALIKTMIRDLTSNMKAIKEFYFLLPSYVGNRGCMYVEEVARETDIWGHFIQEHMLLLHSLLGSSLKAETRSKFLIVEQNCRYLSLSLIEVCTERPSTKFTLIGSQVNYLLCRYGFAMEDSALLQPTIVWEVQDFMDRCGITADNLEKVILDGEELDSFRNAISLLFLPSKIHLCMSKRSKIDMMMSFIEKDCAGLYNTRQMEANALELIVEDEETGKKTLSIDISSIPDMWIYEKQYQKNEDIRISLQYKGSNLLEYKGRMEAVKDGNGHVVTTTVTVNYEGECELMIVDDSTHVILFMERVQLSELLK